MGPRISSETELISRIQITESILNLVLTQHAYGVFQIHQGIQPCLLLLHQPTFQPSFNCCMPFHRIERLHYPMVLIWEEQELGRYALALKSREGGNAFPLTNTEINSTLNHKGGGVPIGQVRVRAPPRGGRALWRQVHPLSS